MGRTIEIEAKLWCFKNEITVYAVPITNTTLKIEVNYKGKLITGKKIFQSNGGKREDDKWWVEVDKIYVDYYKQLNKLT